MTETKYVIGMSNEGIVVEFILSNGTKASGKPLGLQITSGETCMTVELEDGSIKRALPHASMSFSTDRGWHVRDTAQL